MEIESPQATQDDSQLEDNNESTSTHRMRSSGTFSTSTVSVKKLTFKESLLKKSFNLRYNVKSVRPSVNSIHIDDTYETRVESRIVCEDLERAGSRKEDGVRAARRRKSEEKRERLESLATLGGEVIEMEAKLEGQRNEIRSKTSLDH